MASFSIKKRTLRSGESRFTVDIIVKKNSAIIHRESKTFRKKELARTYGNKRVREFVPPNSHQNNPQQDTYFSIDLLKRLICGKKQSAHR
ncbi:hypothetical protein IX92_14460 [Vibrio coralliilyticus]|uniref:Integrase n=1 Tax=Vibrio coralliilyticus TaxID=190893 RepID=A0AAN0VYJ4_9VIBR|nr:hypothetical protein IX92_14460 [Vibrio coralliilyticus]